MERNEGADPLEVSLLGAPGIMEAADARAHSVDEGHGWASVEGGRAGALKDHRHEAEGSCGVGDDFSAEAWGAVHECCAPTWVGGRVAGSLGVTRWTPAAELRYDGEGPRGGGGVAPGLG
jgi:hypothetical protein